MQGRSIFANLFTSRYCSALTPLCKVVVMYLTHHLDIEATLGSTLEAKRSSRTEQAGPIRWSGLIK
jgi:hypothetical protein